MDVLHINYKPFGHWFIQSHFPFIFLSQQNNTHTHTPCFLCLSLNGSFSNKPQYLSQSCAVEQWRSRKVFPFSICHSFSFLFFRWWCGMVCAPRQGWGERKASRWIWVTAATKARFPGLLFVCSQPIGSRRLSPTIHPCKNRKRWKALMTVKGLTRERDREREARTGFCVFLLSSLVVLDVA